MSVVKKHPVLSYYILTFVISWGGILAVVGPAGFPGNPLRVQKMFPVLVLAMLGGPSIASILLTGLAFGKAGYRDLLSRLLKWRVGIGWYAAALLTAPLVWMAVNSALSLRVHEFIPKLFTESNKGTLVAMGSVVGLSAGIFEELGWTGFVIPKLRPRWDAVKTGVIVGFLWGVWHLLVVVVANGTPSGTLNVPGLIGAVIFSLGILSAYRILMIWVWDRTGSLFIAMLMHASLTAMSIILGPSATPGKMAITWNLIMAATLWIVVAAISVITRKENAEAVSSSGSL